MDRKVVAAGGIMQLMADNRYLSVNGRGLRGNLNMTNNEITNLSEPVDGNDAANKLWVSNNLPFG